MCCYILCYDVRVFTSQVYIIYMIIEETSDLYIYINVQGNTKTFYTQNLSIIKEKVKEQASSVFRCFAIFLYIAAMRTS